MPRGSKSVNRPPTPEPEDQQRELTLEEDIRLKVTAVKGKNAAPDVRHNAHLCSCSSYRVEPSKGELA